MLAGSGVFLRQNETVFDDSDVDLLMGGGDVDWFFLQAKKDKSKDKTEAEPLGEGEQW